MAGGCRRNARHRSAGWHSRSSRGARYRQDRWFPFLRYGGGSRQSRRLGRRDGGRWGGGGLDGWGLGGRQNTPALQGERRVDGERAGFIALPRRRGIKRWPGRCRPNLGGGGRRRSGRLLCRWGCRCFCGHEPARRVPVANRRGPGACRHGWRHDPLGGLQGTLGQACGIGHGLRPRHHRVFDVGHIVADFPPDAHGLVGNLDFLADQESVFVVGEHCHGIKPPSGTYRIG